MSGKAAPEKDEQPPNYWANMPPELLRDVIVRVEATESSWPLRRHVVACGAVCSSWRDVTRDVVQCPEVSATLTFPHSLKQPGPRDVAIQCFIKRDRINATYALYLGLPPSPVENGKFLLAARKCRRATSTDYVISLDADDMSRGSSNYVGKLRSNFLGTKFTIYDSQAAFHCAPGAAGANHRAGRRVAAKQVSPRVPAGSFAVASIAYELNVLGTRGPRRMQCTLCSIPVAAMEPGGHVPAPQELPSYSMATMLESLEGEVAAPSSCLPGAAPLPPRAKSAAIADCSSAPEDDVAGVALVAASQGLEGPLVLRNKAPRWHEQLQCWCLNFRGRVTVASVKNFQLVASPDQIQQAASPDHDKVLLQFGKIGKDMFTMDYRYPLSAFQAFAICLSSFDTKLACE